MTTQEMYWNIREYFSRPGAVLSKNTNSAGTRCYYRGPDGSKCAVGCLIPDNLYHSDFEDKTLDRLYVDYPSVARYLGADSKQFLRLAQEMHDYGETKTVQQFLDKLDALALQFNLVPPLPPDTRTCRPIGRMERVNV